MNNPCIKCIAKPACLMYYRQVVKDCEIEINNFKNYNKAKILIGKCNIVAKYYNYLTIRIKLDVMISMNRIVEEFEKR